MNKKPAPNDISFRPAPRIAPLLADVRKLILVARESVAWAVDSGLVALCWHVGRRIHKDILNEQRAEYGKRIVHALSAQLGWTHFRHIIYLADELKRIDILIPPDRAPAARTPTAP